MSETCHLCGGKGYIVDGEGAHERCPDCGGSGVEGGGGIHISAARPEKPGQGQRGNEGAE